MTRRGEGGFTFIEVLVAIAIFTIAGIALATACVNFLGAQHAAFQRDEFSIDRQLMRQALCAEPSRKKAEEWNDLALPDNRTVRWRAVITSAPVTDLFDVSLEMNLPAEGDHAAKQFTETLRLLRPTWSQAAERDTLRNAARQKLARRDQP